MSVEEAALGASADPEVRHDAGDRAQLGAPRLRPARVHARGRRRRGPAVRCDIALELEIPRVLVPPYPGIVAATGLLATDLQHEFVATERHPLKTLDHARSRGASTSSVGRPSPSSRRTACPRTAASSAGSPTAATPARATRSARSACRDDRRRLGRGAEERFHARTRPSTAIASTRRSRSSTSARSRSGAWTSCSRPSWSPATATRRGRRRSSARWSSTSTARPSATRRRSTSGSSCGPATGSRARRSSSSTTRRR